MPKTQIYPLDLKVIQILLMIIIVESWRYRLLKLINLILNSWWKWS